MEDIELFIKNESQAIHSYVYRIVANPEDAEDVVQDTLLAALNRVDAFEGKSTLKTWLFSIASHKAIDLLRKKSRWAENTMDVAKQAALSDAQFFASLTEINRRSAYGKFEVKEHIDLCFTCIAKTLTIECQLALMLKDIYGFRVKEIAEILERTTSQVKHDLENARKKMIDIFDRRCALINKNGVCNQCSELNGIFNPRQQKEQKKNEIKFFKDQASGNKEELYALRTDLVKMIDPLHSDGHAFQQKHLKFICKLAEK